MWLGYGKSLSPHISLESQCEKRKRPNQRMPETRKQKDIKTAQ